MNTTNIKKYAPIARNAFIEAITKRAQELGIYSETKIAETEVQGDTLMIEGRSFALAVKAPRERLIKRVQSIGFNVFMEQIAYTWFNRLCAIRFMELHDYLNHGLLVLSHPTNDKGFEILEHAQDAADELGLDREQVIALKLAGNQDEALYRLLLLGQYHALHQAMPFLFAAINDETELLLPDKLTRTDSILRGLVDDIPAQDWEQVEVIGWLYQFYISEKKDQVIGKVVKSEDIPAATQLFTPNWIVKYLVQNSVGRQWLQTYPDSSLKAGMDYYIEPAEQTPEVGTALAAITPDSIEPESIKVLDPACGSGHILVEAYQVLKAIYEERGYQPREIPQLILENNLFGLDIDDRAAQLAGFALMMLARADDRRIFSREVQLNVLALQTSQGLDAEQLVLNVQQLWQAHYNADEINSLQSITAELISTFAQADCLGSLIQIPTSLSQYLPVLQRALDKIADNIQDYLAQQSYYALMPLLKQAFILGQQYDAVVANPPYMGSKYQTPVVKKYLKDNFKGYEKDLFSAFIIRNLQLAKEQGQLGFMTPFVWMFISSYENLRAKLIDEATITTLIQLEYSGFDGATVPICTFTLSANHIKDYVGGYIKLSDFKGHQNQAPKTLEAIKNPDCGWFYNAKSDDFKKIPGSPIAYWINDNLVKAFDFSKIGYKFPVKSGLTSGDKPRFVRNWTECDFGKINFNAINGEKNSCKWFPHNDGGALRKWYGNRSSIINWELGGSEIKEFEKSTVRSPQYYFCSGITWTDVSSSFFSARYLPTGSVFENTGSIIVIDGSNLEPILGFLCSIVSKNMMDIMNPTLHYGVGEVSQLPLAKVSEENRVSDIVVRCIMICKLDWDSYETSWDFQQNPLVQTSFPRSCVGMQTEPDKSTVCIPTEDGGNESAVGWVSDSVTRHIEAENVGLRDKAANPTYLLSEIYAAWQSHNRETIAEILRLEQENNRLFIDAYGLQDELSPDVPLEQITLTVNPKYRYGGNLSDEALENRFQSDTLAELISYAIGCMMGRYSLDQQGLVYAHAGNQGFSELVQQGTYKTFPADKDGIIPLTDQAWFADDATHRLREFVRVVWGEENHQQNLDFIAASLCLYAIKAKNSESNLDTIRRYLATKFYKDHLKTYKKRPIYWLFSSGKNKAFECLVYLHRYNESTLARMRTEYVTPLLGKYEASAMVLQKQMQDADSTSDANRFKKSLTALEKKQTELSEFDDKLKHYADRRISLDLDDGVKVNYGKFGDLLAEVKAVTGKK